MAFSIASCSDASRTGVSMDKNRIEAFSDGVIAVIITIIVLEMKVPHGPEFASLVPLLPVFLTYVLSLVKSRDCCKFVRGTRVALLRQSFVL